MFRLFHLRKIIDFVSPCDERTTPGGVGQGGNREFALKIDLRKRNLSSNMTVGRICPMLRSTNLFEQVYWPKLTCQCLALIKANSININHIGTFQLPSLNKTKWRPKTKLDILSAGMHLFNCITSSYGLEIKHTSSCWNPQINWKILKINLENERSNSIWSGKGSPKTSEDETDLSISGTSSLLSLLDVIQPFWKKTIMRNQRPFVYVV